MSIMDLGAELHATGRTPGVWIRERPPSRWLAVNKLGTNPSNKAVTDK